MSGTAIRTFDVQLLGFTFTRDVDPTDVSDGDGDDEHSDSEPEDHVVWDVLDPFAPQDPGDERLRSLIRAEVTHMRRYESIGPLQSLDDDDSDGDSEDYGAWINADADKEATTIALPRLLHTDPICGFISPSPTTDDDDDDDEAEEQERARKAKRDAHRSRLKAIAILGPEAASAF